MKTDYAIRLFVLFSIVSTGLSSCVNTKKAIYFDEVKDNFIYKNNNDFEPLIQKNDILQIIVSCLNPADAQLYNTPNFVATSGSGTGVIPQGQGAGFLVDQQGNIQYPVLGNIKAAGLTKNELKDKLLEALNSRQLLKDPVMNIRFLNYRVTVLGEVAKPTVVNVTNEKISLMEALGMAGDITIYGRRDRVLLVRDTVNQRIVRRLDLTKEDIFISPYYYLQTNDIVYVEPNKAKMASSQRTQQILPIVLSGLSFLAIILDRVFR